jgi:hypothetical protein
VPAARRERAARECAALEVRIAAGRWDGNSFADPDALGLLVMEGVLVRKVGVDGRAGAELLGEGDLLRPWQEDSEPLTLRWTSEWRVLEPARIAVLDEQFARVAGRYPRLVARLVGRTVQRSRHLAVNLAIVHHARVDVRLHLLLWYFAGRWGRVRGDGVTVPIKLTHAVLADLVAARRPTVTSALTDLGRQGLVRPVDEGWLLAGQAPGELAGINQSVLQQLG